MVITGLTSNTRFAVKATFYDEDMEMWIPYCDVRYAATRTIPSLLLWEINANTIVLKQNAPCEEPDLKGMMFLVYSFESRKEERFYVPVQSIGGTNNNNNNDLEEGKTQTTNVQSSVMMRSRIVAQMKQHLLNQTYQLRDFDVNARYRINACEVFKSAVEFGVDTDDDDDDGEPTKTETLVDIIGPRSSSLLLSFGSNALLTRQLGDNYAIVQWQSSCIVSCYGTLGDRFFLKLTGLFSDRTVVRHLSPDDLQRCNYRFADLPRDRYFISLIRVSQFSRLEDLNSSTTRFWQHKFVPATLCDRFVPQLVQIGENMISFFPVVMPLARDAWLPHVDIDEYSPEDEANALRRIFVMYRHDPSEGADSDIRGFDVRLSKEVIQDYTPFQFIRAASSVQNHGLVVISNLQPGTKYHLSVRVHISGLFGYYEGVWSPPCVISTRETPKIRCVSSGDDFAVLHWERSPAEEVARRLHRALERNAKMEVKRAREARRRQQQQPRRLSLTFSDSIARSSEISSQFSHENDEDEAARSSDEDTNTTVLLDNADADDEMIVDLTKRYPLKAFDIDGSQFDVVDPAVAVLPQSIGVGGAGIAAVRPGVAPYILQRLMYIHEIYRQLQPDTLRPLGTTRTSATTSPYGRRTMSPTATSLATPTEQQQTENEIERREKLIRYRHTQRSQLRLSYFHLLYEVPTHCQISARVNNQTVGKVVPKFHNSFGLSRLQSGVRFLIRVRAHYLNTKLGAWSDGVAVDTFSNISATIEAVGERYVAVSITSVGEREAKFIGTALAPQQDARAADWANASGSNHGSEKNLLHTSIRRQSSTIVVNQKHSASRSGGKMGTGSAEIKLELRIQKIDDDDEDDAAAQRVMSLSNGAISSIFASDPNVEYREFFSPRLHQQFFLMDLELDAPYRFAMRLCVPGQQLVTAWSGDHVFRTLSRAHILVRSLTFNSFGVLWGRVKPPEVNPEKIRRGVENTVAYLFQEHAVVPSMWEVVVNEVKAKRSRRNPRRLKYKEEHVETRLVKHPIQELEISGTRSGGLRPDTTYSVRVRYTDALGYRSEFSDVAYARTMQSMISTVTAISEHYAVILMSREGTIKQAQKRERELLRQKKREEATKDDGENDDDINVDDDDDNIPDDSSVSSYEDVPESLPLDEAAMILPCDEVERRKIAKKIEEAQRRVCEDLDYDVQCSTSLEDDGTVSRSPGRIQIRYYDKYRAYERIIHGLFAGETVFAAVRTKSIWRREIYVPWTGKTETIPPSWGPWSRPITIETIQPLMLRVLDLSEDRFTLEIQRSAISRETDDSAVGAAGRSSAHHRGRPPPILRAYDAQTAPSTVLTSSQFSVCLNRVIQPAASMNLAPGGIATLTFEGLKLETAYTVSLSNGMEMLGVTQADWWWRIIRVRTQPQRPSVPLLYEARDRNLAFFWRAETQDDAAAVSTLIHMREKEGKSSTGKSDAHKLLLLEAESKKHNARTVGHDQRIKQKLTEMAVAQIDNLSLDLTPGVLKKELDFIDRSIDLLDIKDEAKRAEQKRVLITTVADIVAQSAAETSEDKDDDDGGANTPVPSVASTASTPDDIFAAMAPHLANRSATNSPVKKNLLPALPSFESPLLNQSVHSASQSYLGTSASAPTEDGNQAQQVGVDVPKMVMGGHHTNPMQQPMFLRLHNLQDLVAYVGECTAKEDTIDDSEKALGVAPRRNWEELGLPPKIYTTRFTARAAVKLEGNSMRDVIYEDRNPPLVEGYVVDSDESDDDEGHVAVVVEESSQRSPTKQPTAAIPKPQKRRRVLPEQYKIEFRIQSAAMDKYVARVDEASSSEDDGDNNDDENGGLPSHDFLGQKGDGGNNGELDAFRERILGRGNNNDASESRRSSRRRPKQVWYTALVTDQPLVRFQLPTHVSQPFGEPFNGGPTPLGSIMQRLVWRVRRRRGMRGVWSRPSVGIAWSLPPPPTVCINVNVASVMHNSACLTWDPPQNAGRHNQLVYSIWLQHIEDDPRMKVVGRSSETHFIVSNLLISNVYRVAVSAVSTYGYGPRSVPLRFRTASHVPRYSAKFDGARSPTSPHHNANNAVVDDFFQTFHLDFLYGDSTARKTADWSKTYPTDFTLDANPPFDPTPQTSAPKLMDVVQLTAHAFTQNRMREEEYSKMPASDPVGSPVRGQSSVGSSKIVSLQGSPLGQLTVPSLVAVLDGDDYVMSFPDSGGWLSESPAREFNLRRHSHDNQDDQTERQVIFSPLLQHDKLHPQHDVDDEAPIDLAGLTKAYWDAKRAQVFSPPLSILRPSSAVLPPDIVNYTEEGVKTYADVTAEHEKRQALEYDRRHRLRKNVVVVEPVRPAPPIVDDGTSEPNEEKDMLSSNRRSSAASLGRISTSQGGAAMPPHSALDADLEGVIRNMRTPTPTMFTPRPPSASGGEFDNNINTTTTYPTDVYFSRNPSVDLEASTRRAPTSVSTSSAMRPTSASSSAVTSLVTPSESTGGDNVFSFEFRRLMRSRTAKLCNIVVSGQGEGTQQMTMTMSSTTARRSVAGLLSPTKARPTSLEEDWAASVSMQQQHGFVPVPPVDPSPAKPAPMFPHLPQTAPKQQNHYRSQQRRSYKSPPKKRLGALASGSLAYNSKGQPHVWFSSANQELYHQL